MTNKELIIKAFEVRNNSYSPYSNFKVGAALLSKDGRVFTGCNIESCAYTPSNCAERTAFFKAVSEGVKEFEAIAVVGGPASEGDTLSRIATPCGICRQVMYEFCEDDFRIIMATTPDEIEECKLADLLPRAFTPKSL